MCVDIKERNEIVGALHIKVSEKCNVQGEDLHMQKAQ
jgi:hypothetical protein